MEQQISRTEDGTSIEFFTTGDLSSFQHKASLFWGENVLAQEAILPG
jgi:hypothetical protein